MPSRRIVLQSLGAAMAIPARATEAPPAPAGECVFCQIIAGRREGTVVWEDERCIALADRYPRAPGHTLLLPRMHVQDLYALPPALAAQLFAFAPRLARELKLAFAADGMTLIQNNERAGDQTVFHFHLHFVPRTAGIELFRNDAPRPELAPATRERQFAPVRAALAG